MWSNLIGYLAKKLPYLDRDVFFWKQKPLAKNSPISAPFSKKPAVIHNFPSAFQPANAVSSDASATPEKSSAKQAEPPASAEQHSEKSIQLDQTLEKPGSTESISDTSAKSEQPDSQQENAIPPNEILVKASETYQKPLVPFASPAADRLELIDIIDRSAEFFNFWRKTASYSTLWVADLNLSRRDLKESRWQNCILINVSFKGTDLQNASFHGAILQNVDFSEANILDCDFSGVDLNNTYGVNQKQINKISLLKENHWLLKPKSFCIDTGLSVFKYSAKEFDYCLMFLDLCKKKLKKQEISEKIGLSTRSKLFRLLYADLLEHKYISKTLPDKSQSKLQQYYTTPDGLDFYNKHNRHASISRPQKVKEPL